MGVGMGMGMDFNAKHKKWQLGWQSIESLFLPVDSPEQKLVLAREWERVQKTTTASQKQPQISFLCAGLVGFQRVPASPSRDEQKNNIMNRPINVVNVVNMCLQVNSSSVPITVIILTLIIHFFFSNPTF